MPNSRPDMMTNDTAAIATLNIRTTALEGRVNELTNAINSVQTTLAGKIDGIATTLSSKIDERGRTPWAIYISGLMAVFSLYAYIDNSKIGPLKEKDDALYTSVKELSSVIRTDMVPQWVHTQQWAQRDQKFKEFDDRVKFTENALSERIKRMEDQYSQTWSVRDALTTLDQRIRHFEMMTTQSKHQN